MEDTKEILKTKQESGITLIVLVIMVVVLLILAIITVGFVTGENGIIKKSKNAKVEYEKAYYIDQIELAKQAVAKENLGIATIDNVIEKIYKNNVVPRGYITKQSDTTAKMITKEGYEFIITADGEISKPSEEVIPPIKEGMIVISAEIWDAQIHTASVNITKGSTVSKSLQIQYQVNGYEEGKWTTGTKVNNLKHNDIVYARLWNGIRGGDYTSHNVKDGVLPKDASISWTSATTIAPGANITAQIVLRDDESGVSVANSKWELTMSSTTKLGTDASKYSGNFIGTDTTQPITTTKTQAGTYYLHVLTQDKAGNKVETIYLTGITVEQQPITIAGISLNKSATTIEIGKTETLIATVTPNNASNKNVTWSSSDESIATVSSTGVVTAKQLGKATITARTQEGNKTASCEVTADLVAGAYIKYDTGVTSVGENGVVMFRILYPTHSEYGLQIVSDRSVGSGIRLGGRNWEEGKVAYNGVIEKLNNEAGKYVNTAYAYDGRCVGSLPTVQNGMFINKNKVRDSEGNIQDTLGTVSIPEDWTTPNWTMPTGWTSRDTGCYVGDTNYTIDETALKESDMCIIGQSYWLASREIEQSSDTIFFAGRAILNSGDLLGGLCYMSQSSEGGWVNGYWFTKGLRPCISLKSDIIKITGGDGTAGNPYTIGLK